jgi:hypothetical protein
MRFNARAGRRVIAAVASIGALALAINCVDLDSLGAGRGLDGGSQPATDGLADSAPPDPCEHLGPPPPPKVAIGGTQLPPFDVAIDQVQIDSDVVRGYDLDGLCTCDDRPNVKGGATCVGGVNSCDLDGGVDNTAGAVARGVGQAVTGGLARLANRIISTGKRTLLFRISEYNGSANDDRVSVAAILAEGIRAPGCDASTPDPSDSGFYSPGHCGDDSWLVAPDALYPPKGDPAVIDVDAYVSNWQLVARFRSNPVVIPFTEVSEVSFSGAVVTAEIVPLDENLGERQPPDRTPTSREQRLFALRNGIVAGRVSTRTLLRSVGTYISALAEGPLCKSVYFRSLRTSVCEAVDMQFAPTNPPDASAPCDALSAAFGFSGLPALEGAKTTLAKPADPCADAAGNIFDCP